MSVDGLRVGWFLPSSCSDRQADKQIALHCRRYGEAGYSFICYPVGGLDRDRWHPERWGLGRIYLRSPLSGQPVPPLHLPDLQMPSAHWQRHVTGCISGWINPDAGDRWVAEMSAESLEEVGLIGRAVTPFRSWDTSPTWDCWMSSSS